MCPGGRRVMGPDGWRCGRCRVTLSSPYPNAGPSEDAQRRRRLRPGGAAAGGIISCHMPAACTAFCELGDPARVLPPSPLSPEAAGRCVTSWLPGAAQQLQQGHGRRRRRGVCPAGSAARRLLRVRASKQEAESQAAKEKKKTRDGNRSGRSRIEGVTQSL